MLEQVEGIRGRLGEREEFQLELDDDGSRGT